MELAFTFEKFETSHDISMSLTSFKKLMYLLRSLVKKTLPIPREESITKSLFIPLERSFASSDPVRDAHRGRGFSVGVPARLVYLVKSSCERMDAEMIVSP